MTERVVRGHVQPNGLGKLDNILGAVGMGDPPCDAPGHRSAERAPFHLPGVVNSRVLRPMVGSDSLSGLGRNAIRPETVAIAEKPVAELGKSQRPPRGVKACRPRKFLITFCGAP